MHLKTAKAALKASLLGGATLMASVSADTAIAQESGPASADDGNEIIVTARRRDESLQDVPQTVNAVTGDAIERLNITRFEDIETVVPGLALQSVGDGFTFRASLRGIGYDSIASVPANVEFYVNDALVSPFSLFQSMYDIGQIEVLRGPQGTLRGRAAPSGSITVTTRKPDLEQAGGFINASATNKSAYNGSAAINIPLLQGVAALRLSGLIDDNEGDHVRPLVGGREPFSKTKSGRISLAVAPADWLDANVMYQVLDRHAESYGQVESIRLSQPNAPLGFGSNVLIRARDRRSIGDDPTFVDEIQRLLIGNVNVRFAGQQLSYVGSYFKAVQDTGGPQDTANIFPGQSIYQFVPVTAKQKTHELRLSSVERIMDMFDYTVGVFHSKTTGKNPVTAPSVIAFGANIPPGVPGFPLFIQVANSQIDGLGKQSETSYFGNLTAHLGERTELSGGLRHITFDDTNFLALVSPIQQTIQDIDEDYKATVYNFSLKHRFSDTFMAYANTGSSWRKGTSAIGIFRPQTPRLAAFINVHPEKSKSYEIGFKTSLLDRKLDINVAAFHQKFNGFLYRNTTAVNFVDLNFATGVPVERLGAFNFLANVPAKVTGVEIQANYRPSSRFYVDAQFSYAKGKITGGQVACNDVNGDGVPDTAVPTIEQIKAVSGGEAVAACSIRDRVSNQPNWSVNLQSEYALPVADGAEAYLRGLFNYSPDNPNDPANAFDSVNAYGLLNLYLGIRDPDGAWEVGAFAKNVTNTFRVLSRGNRPIATSALVDPTFASSKLFQGNYVAISSTPPREFGLSLRVAFGSR